MPKKTFEEIQEMFKDASHKVAVHGRYKHFKDEKHVVQVTGFCLNEAQDEIGVLYYPIEWGPQFVVQRPLSSWLEKVSRGIEDVDRWTFIGVEEEALVEHVGYFVHGDTGCSCCQNENVAFGLWDTEEEALESALRNWEAKTVRSQYSDHGIYKVIKVKYSNLPGARVLIGDYVYDRHFYESGNRANDIEYAGEVVNTMK